MDILKGVLTILIELVVAMIHTFLDITQIMIVGYLPYGNAWTSPFGSLHFETKLFEQYIEGTISIELLYTSAMVFNDVCSNMVGSVHKNKKPYKRILNIIY